MPQAPVISSPVALPAVDLREPSTIMFLPPWLATQISAVSDLGAGRTIVDPANGKITGRVATIPRSRMPTGPQRAAIMQRIEELRGATRPGPEKRTLSLVGEIVNEQATSRLDEDTAVIKIGAFMDAVEDLPFWALREALRRWRRGEVSDKSQLPFGIKPHKLRDMALMIRASAEGQAIRLQRILDAEPEDELSEAQRGEMQAKIAAEVRPQGIDTTDTPSPHRRDIEVHLADLAARKAKREAEDQSSLSAQLKAGKEPFEIERKGEAA